MDGDDVPAVRPVRWYHLHGRSPLDVGLEAAIMIANVLMLCLLAGMIGVMIFTNTSMDVVSGPGCRSDDGPGFGDALR